ncbi:enoyl-CoA hydratase/isomerase family protein [Orrella daihaiensis]|uniref:Enoyl-CoA hydratase/isomerase family protein n=1 Tax=Orrella daihaiensis TaxID=2782176 RepID=A0ABY4AKL6_9BURK|nr:enoyl-CoA hydratase/isomerase family protein [Orrella daihaiensis]UOD50724.1 enoyl-CoA hydratase/isomerase family protein [Orrella daihaiensis]
MTTAAGPNILVDTQGAVTILKLSYPEKRNALSMPLREKLGDALRECLNDEACRVIVLTGEGGHFSSGGDITGFDGVNSINGRTRMQKTHDMVRMIMNSEKPIIAAVEGHAAGAGMCVAADCDIVVASTEAKFTCSFNKIGLLPDLGGLWSIPARMGLGRAKMMMLTGRTLDATSAQAQGLVEQLCEPGQALQTAIALAQEIAQFAPLTHGLTKAALARGSMSVDALLALEVDLQGLMFGTEDFQEGRTAFLEKRKPAFKGK